jgi:enamine deaminase RidA (YjgF/YER057c/UK114 family)
MKKKTFPLSYAGKRQRFALEEAGSGLEHIVKMTIYLKNISDYQAMRDAEFHY